LRPRPTIDNGLSPPRTDGAQKVSTFFLLKKKEKKYLLFFVCANKINEIITSNCLPTYFRSRFRHLYCLVTDKQKSILFRRKVHFFIWATKQTSLEYKNKKPFLKKKRSFIQISFSING